MSTADLMAQRRPARADARRNFDALIAAAREEFASTGTGASLEEIARRAGVGIGTLYRNFPTREDLIEIVYVDEIESLRAYSETLGEMEPWDALAAWLRRFLRYVGTKRVLIDSLNRDSAAMLACRGTLADAGGPLLEKAQRAGVVREDTDIDDVMRLAMGVVGVSYVDDDQRDRVLGMALDGIRTR